jgi:hypothetical protein
MGTFIVRANSPSDVDLQSGGVPDAAIPSGTLDAAEAIKIAGDFKFLSCGSIGFPNSFRVNIISLKVFLDGGLVPLGINDLPPGFVVDDAKIVIASTLFGGFDDFVNSNSSGSILKANIDIGNPIRRSTDLPITTFTEPTEIVLPLPISNPSLFAFLGFRWDNSNSVSYQMDRLVITGNYHIETFQWTLNPVSGSNVEQQQTITVTSDPGDPNHLQLNNISQLVLFGCGVIIPSVQTQNLLVFSIPTGCGPGLRNLIATGNGIQFSGDITLGSYTILVADASGIYTIVPGKTDDTLYKSARDGTTFDVKIPDPFIKTGFIGG